MMQAPEFLDYLQDACNRAGTGFHFEEGGCWGMALALHETLVENGYESRVVFMPDCVHSAVELDGERFDYTGKIRIPETSRDISFSDPDEFLAFSVRSSGYTEGEILSDKQYASELIIEAWELARQATPAPAI